MQRFAISLGYAKFTIFSKYDLVRTWLDLKLFLIEINNTD